MLYGERGGSQTSRLAERTAEGSEVESLSCSALFPSARRREFPFFLPHFKSQSPRGVAFLSKLLLGKHWSLYHPLHVKAHLLSRPVSSVPGSTLSVPEPRRRLCLLYPSTQNPAAVVTGMRTFSRHLQPQALMSENLVPSCRSVSTLVWSV